jgi:peroxiredoxin Q/BCP
MSIEIGDTAPDFTLQDDSGSSVTLRDLRGDKVLLYFYPKAFTPGCTTQACDLRDRHESFDAAGYRVLGISPDPVDKLAEFRAEYDLPFPLLSDPDHAVAAAYGAWGIKKNYGREYEGLIRSTFVIDDSGIVEQAWRNVRASGHGDRMIRELVGDAE